MQNGGTPLEDTECSDSCERGACCTGFGCLDNVAPSQCPAGPLQSFILGGRCETVTCPLAGACCGNFFDGAETCVLTTALECTGDFGTYQGDDTRCSADLCIAPTGACCAGGLCEPDLTLVGCTAVVGDWQGPATQCTEGICIPAPPDGACCTQDDCFSDTEERCQSLIGFVSWAETGDCSTCSFQEPTVFARRRHAVRSCTPTPVPTGPTEPPSPAPQAGSCRPKLGCMCVNCVDQFDFELDGEHFLAPLCLGGRNEDPQSVLNTVLRPNAVIAAGCPATDELTSDTCMALQAGARELFADTQLNGTLEPLVALTSDDATTRLRYSAKQHDVYRFHTNEARIAVELRSLGGVPSLTNSQAAPMMYLISTAGNCQSPRVIRYSRFIFLGAAGVTPFRVEFLIPCPGEYLLVISAVLGNAPFDRELGETVTAAQRAAARCIDYGVVVLPQPNLCSPALCNRASCHDARDCSQSRSCNACHPTIHRCIVGVPVDKCSGALPQHDPCTDAADGVTCIAALFANGMTDDDDENDGQIRCTLGVCRARVCTPAVTDNPSTFQCDCRCRATCTQNSECDDGNVQTIDRCFEGTCVSRPRLGTNPTTDDRCNKFTDLLDAAQPIVAPCSTEHDPPVRAIGDIDNPQVVVVTTSAQSDSTTTRVPCLVAGFGDPTLIDCAVTATPVCVRMVGNEQVQFQCTEPPAPLALARDAMPVAPAKCAARALDAAEVAHAEAAFDVFGAFDIVDRRTPPLCGADIEGGRVSVDVELHGARTDAACCSSDLSALSRTCLDGARVAHASGHEWLDRAWLALDRATRHLQRGAAADSQRESCCAALYYAALASACGRHGDRYQLGSAPRVVRIGDGAASEAPGAECVLFDDGHVDGDLNDLVAEQRVVEIYDSAARLRAVNVHVLPLARGGGYRASYVLSARGTTLRALERPATAACSARTRALLHDAYDPAQVNAQLRARAGVPERAFVGVLHHALSNDRRLPLGVRHAECTTVGGDDAPAYCPVARDAVTLIGDLRQALPLGANDTLERLLSAGVKFDQSTNTQPQTRLLRARFAVSATVALPRRGSPGAGSGELRFALVNEDCGAAVVLPPTTESVPAVPMALTVPANACGSWRWAAEGHKLVQSAYDTERTCRGGDNGGIEQCGAASADVCTASGGACAEAPRSAGVPYQYAFEHFTNCQRCRTERQCGADVACFGSRCCSEQVLHWYNYPTMQHLFVPRDPVAGLEQKK